MYTRTCKRRNDMLPNSNDFTTLDCLSHDQRCQDIPEAFMHSLISAAGKHLCFVAGRNHGQWRDRRC